MTDRQQKSATAKSDSKKVETPKPAEPVSEQRAQGPRPGAILQRAFSTPQPAPASPTDILTLQRTVGNRATHRLLARSLPAAPSQAKLTVGPANDPYEQEADRVAAQVMGQLGSPRPDAGNRVQRQQTPERDEDLQRKPLVETIQRQATAADGMTVSADVDSAIQSARGGGQPLAESVRTSMEQAFGADFGGVKVHTGPQADTLNRAVQARAFTTGQDIFFRGGEYAPGSRDGQRLLAHELTHVVQQTPDHTARRQTPPVARRSGAGVIQRMGEEDKGRLGRFIQSKVDMVTREDWLKTFVTPELVVAQMVIRAGQGFQQYLNDSTYEAAEDLVVEIFHGLDGEKDHYWYAVNQASTTLNFFGFPVDAVSVSEALSTALPGCPLPDHPLNPVDLAWKDSLPGGVREVSARIYSLVSERAIARDSRLSQETPSEVNVTLEDSLEQVNEMKSEIEEETTSSADTSLHAGFPPPTPQLIDAARTASAYLRDHYGSWLESEGFALGLYRRKDGRVLYTTSGGMGKNELRSAYLDEVMPGLGIKKAPYLGTQGKKCAACNFPPGVALTATIEVWIGTGMDNPYPLSGGSGHGSLMESCDECKERFTQSNRKLQSTRGMMQGSARLFGLTGLIKKNQSSSNNNNSKENS